MYDNRVSGAHLYLQFGNEMIRNWGGDKRTDLSISHRFEEAIVRATSIRKYLKPYKVLSRKSTITHAFAAAIAPYDTYDIDRINEAIRFLGQDPGADLKCVYCNQLAQTWDHLICTVRDREFSGAGHRIGNLVPSCTRCNTQKRNLTFDVFIDQLPLSEEERLVKITLLRDFQTTFFALDQIPHSHPRYSELRSVLAEVVKLMHQADQIAEAIRAEQAHSEQSDVRRRSIGS